MSEPTVIYYLSGGSTNGVPLASLGGQRSSTLLPDLSTLFDDIGYNESHFGDSESRCIYLYNPDSAQAVFQLGAYVVQATLSDGSPAPEKIYIALDPAGLGNGLTTGVARVVASEDVMPNLGVPSSVSALAIAGGSLTAGTFYYVVTALDQVGETIGSTEVSAYVNSSTTASVNIAWAAISGAVKYHVYGRTHAAQTAYWETTSVSFTDNGTGGALGTVPTTSTAGIVFASPPPSSESTALGPITINPQTGIPLWFKRTVPALTDFRHWDRPILQLIYGV